MAALMQRSAVLPAPRTRFAALLVAPMSGRRQRLAGQLRGMGARDVVEVVSGAEARLRARRDGGQDLCVIDGTSLDSPVIPLLGALRGLGWTRFVLLTPRDDPYAVRAALGAGIRGYTVVRPETTSAMRNARRPRRGSPDELSDREIEVLELVAEGRSNKEIGEALGLSALTVKSHLARIGRKLGTGDRAELVARAMRAALID